MHTTYDLLGQTAGPVVHDAHVRVHHYDEWWPEPQASAGFTVDLIYMIHVVDCNALMTVSLPRSSWGRFKGVKDLRLELHLSKVPTQMQLKHT